MKQPRSMAKPSPKNEEANPVFPDAKGPPSEPCRGTPPQTVSQRRIGPIKSGAPDVLFLVRRLIIFELSCMVRAQHGTASSVRAPFPLQQACCNTTAKGTRRCVSRRENRACPRRFPPLRAACTGNAVIYRNVIRQNASAGGNIHVRLR